MIFCQEFFLKEAMQIYSVVHKRIGERGRKLYS